MRGPKLGVLVFVSCFCAATLFRADRVAGALPVAQTDLPSDVLALLPSGADVEATLNADFLNAGSLQWAVLYARPLQDATPAGVPLVDDDLAIISGTLPAASAPAVIRTIGFANGVASAFRTTAPGSLERVNLPGYSGIAVTLPIGVHAGRLGIVRWDGSDFGVVFDKQSDRPAGLTLSDLDGDGVPDVVDREPSLCVYNWAGSPDRVGVYRWIGGLFADTTGQFPALLQEATADARSMLDAVAAGRAPEGASADYRASHALQETACLHALLAEIGAKSGDQQTSMTECAEAHAALPNFSLLPRWAQNVCA